MGITIMKLLKYGNTNTFYLPGTRGGLLLDTNYAGTLPAFFKALKQNGITIKDILYLLVTHYHPDHMGIAGELMDLGVDLLLVDIQTDAVHFSDRIFDREKRPYISIREEAATVISCKESRDFLETLGIDGEILPTPSHSKDSISLVLDDGDCFVGDLEPLEYRKAYENNEALKRDWDTLLAFHPKRIFYAHRPPDEFR